MINLDVWANLSFEITALLKKVFQSLLCVINIPGCVGSARRVIGDLQQTRVSKFLGCFWEVINTEIDGRLQNKKNTDAVCFRPKIQFDLLKTTTFQGGDGLIHFGLRQGLIRVLLYKWKKLVRIQVRLTSEFNGNDILSLVRRQHFSSLRGSGGAPLIS